MIWTEELPTKSGKYIVQTKSLILKTINTIDAILSIDKKGKPNWSFNNQTFYRYLNQQQ